MNEAELLLKINELVASLRWALETFVPEGEDADELMATYGENACFGTEMCWDHIHNYDAICQELGLPRAIAEWAIDKRLSEPVGEA